MTEKFENLKTEVANLVKESEMLKILICDKSDMSGEYRRKTYFCNWYETLKEKVKKLYNIINKDDNDNKYFLGEFAIIDSNLQEMETIIKQFYKINNNNQI